MNPNFICFFSLIAFLTSCNKNIKDDFPEENFCEKYAGNYEMYDPLENVHYDMKVSCTNGVILGSTKWDSIHFENFGNKFSFGQGVGSNSMGGVIINPLQDKNGYNWNFSNNHFPDTLNRINVFLNDSIFIYMNYDNTAFWIDQGVSFESVETIHSGLKIH